MSPGGRARASTDWLVSRIASPVVLVSCSTRAATLTVSPINVNSSLPPPPMVPAITTTGVDPDADPQRAAESLGDEAVDQDRGAHRGVGMIGQVVRRAEDGQRAVAEELVDVPTGIDDGGHDDLEQRVEPGDGVLGGVRLGERREVADVDEHHRHLAALTGEHVVTLLEQPRRQGRVDVGAERRLKSLPLSQTRLHAVERRRQRAQVIVLNHRQALAVVPGRNPFGSFGEVANGSQGRRERERRR